MIVFNTCGELRIEVVDGSLIRLTQTSLFTGEESQIDVPADRISDVINALKRASAEIDGAA